MSTFHRTTIYEALGREPVHPFPARMAPGIALQVMLDTTRTLRVLDPMMGSGTVLALARQQGHRAIGFDIDPLAVLITRVWTTAFDAEDVRDQAEEVLARARVTFRRTSQARAYPRNADDETCRFVSYWFDPYARRQLYSLAEAIEELSCHTVRDVLWCAFSRLIITKQAGASLAMDLSHSRPHRTFETAPEKPFKRFLDMVEHVLANCIDKASPRRGPAPSARLGDAQVLPLSDNSVDLVLTSPPYLNAIDYIRCSKFSLVWIGYSIAELRRLRTNSVGAEASRAAASEDHEVSRVVAALNLEPQLDAPHRRILARYIHDMRRAISEVGRVLSSNGKAVYVVGENTLRGTYIRTSLIVSALAERTSLKLIDRSTRALPASRRYMPPPSLGHKGGKIEARMRREVVLTFVK